MDGMLHDRPVGEGAIFWDRTVVNLGYGNADTLFRYAAENPRTLVYGIERGPLPPGTEDSDAVRFIQGDFAGGLRDNFGPDSVHGLHSDMAFGYYGSMGHRTWDEKYNREVAELAFSRLAPEEAFYVVAFETDTARIKALLESAGFAVSSEKVPHEEASRTAWIKMLQVHQGVQLEQIVATKPEAQYTQCMY